MYHKNVPLSMCSGLIVFLFAWAQAAFASVESWWMNLWQQLRRSSLVSIAKRASGRISLMYLFNEARGMPTSSSSLNARLSSTEWRYKIQILLVTSCLVAKKWSITISSFVSALGLLLASAKLPTHGGWRKTEHARTPALHDPGYE